ncbi:hypothetical protein YC2023_047347 [Brassica napus]
MHPDMWEEWWRPACVLDMQPDIWSTRCRRACVRSHAKRHTGDHQPESDWLAGWSFISNLCNETKIEFKSLNVGLINVPKKKPHSTNNLSVHRNRIFSTLSTWQVHKKPRVITVKPVKATTDIILSPAFLYKKHTNKNTETCLCNSETSV